VDDQDGFVDVGGYNLWIRINNKGGCFEYLMQIQQ